MDISNDYTDKIAKEQGNVVINKSIYDEYKTLAFKDEHD